MFAASLHYSNNAITSQNISLMKSLEKKLADPATSQKAVYWFPRAKLVHEKSNEMIAYIDSLKYQLIAEAGAIMINGKQSFRENDFNAVLNLFDKKEKGEELKKRLLKFDEDVLAIDSMFKTIISTTVRLKDPSENAAKTFTDTFFGNIPAVAALAILDKFQNDIRIVENELIGFCNNKIQT